MTLDIKAVSPKAGPQFSPNLYAWLRKNHKTEKAEVFRSKDGILYVGYMFDGDLIGSGLASILGTGARAQVFSFGGGREPKRTFRLVKSFWAKYMTLGRCHIDPKHTTSFIDERWKEDKNRRTCLWCGHVQKKVTRKKTVVVHSWVTA